jgi:4-hydroxy-tetrahydrodipicolinate reductase
MVRVIMHGCNGVMGQVITGMAKDMEGLTIVAGIDLKNDKENGYPVYASLEECKEEADAVVDFASWDR